MRAFLRWLNIGRKLQIFGAKKRVLHSNSKPFPLTEHNQNITV